MLRNIKLFKSIYQSKANSTLAANATFNAQVLPSFNLGYLRNSLLLLSGLITPTVYYNYKNKDNIDVNPHTIPMIASNNIKLERVIEDDLVTKIKNTFFNNMHLTKQTLKRSDLISAEFRGDLTKVYYLGPNVCGHKGIVHGGLLATLLQQATREFCNLDKTTTNVSYSVNYRRPAMASQAFIIKAQPPYNSDNGLTIKAALFDQNGILLTDIETVFKDQRI